MKQEIIELVEQAKNNSQKAFAKLYYTYKSTIWFTIYNIVKNTDVADDLTSIVFTKAYEKLSSYVNHISFEMWLKTIAVNTAIDYIRRTKKENLNTYTDDEECNIQLTSETDLSPEEKLILQEKLMVVEEGLKNIKKKYRDLIEARINDMSYKDMAVKFNINENTVKSLLNKARQVLKKKTQISV